MSLRSLAYNFGLTREKRIELSDKLFIDGYVDSKFHDRTTTYTGIFVFNDNYYVKLISDLFSKTIESFSLYNFVERGDNVRIFYREVFNLSYDYSPGNFDVKREVDSKKVAYRIVDVKKIIKH